MLKRLFQRLFQKRIISQVTGKDRILKSKAMKSANNFELTQDQEGTNYNKDRTGRVTMNTYSRGHLFYVTSAEELLDFGLLYTVQNLLHKLLFQLLNI